MGWARFDDSRADHPKLLAAGLEARGLDEAAITWCAKQETDGFLDTASLAYLAARHGCPTTRATRLAARLVEVGRWERVAGGWLVHDFLEYNFSRAQIAERRAADRERHQKGGKRQRPPKVPPGVPLGNPTGSPPGTPPDSAADSAHDSVCPDPTRPDLATAAAQRPATRRTAVAAAAEWRPTFEAAVEVLVDRHLERNPSRGGRERHRQAVRAGKGNDHITAAQRHLEANPGLSAEQLADLLEPPSTPARSDPIESSATAQRALARRNEVRREFPCGQCMGTGWDHDDEGFAVQCGVCQGSGTSGVSVR